MDLKVFLTIFIAELGDKIQLSTMLFEADKAVNKYTVFFAASSIGVLAGGFWILYPLQGVYVNRHHWLCFGK